MGLRITIIRCIYILCNKEIYGRYMRQFLIFVMQAFYTIVVNMIDDGFANRKGVTFY